MTVEVVRRVLDVVRAQPERRALRSGFVDKGALLRSLESLARELDDGVEEATYATFQLAVRTDTPAFEDDEYEELRSILLRVADSIGSGKDRGNVRDKDNRTVGRWELLS
jgi:hypothetical protein